VVRQNEQVKKARQLQAELILIFIPVIDSTSAVTANQWTTPILMRAIVACAFFVLVWNFIRHLARSRKFRNELYWIHYYFF
jgi:hypothetical protein